MLRELERTQREGLLVAEEIRPNERNVANPGPTAVKGPGASPVRLVAVKKTGVGEDGEHRLQFYDGKKQEDV